MSQPASPEPLVPERRWYQFSLRSLLLATAGSSILLAVFFTTRGQAPDPAPYAKPFAKLISSADRVVVRDGGYDCCGPIEGQRILFEVTDPDELAELSNNLQFVRKEPSRSCACCGWPGIDWYCGDRRVALTSIKHGAALRWTGFPGDAELTPESAEWLQQWLEKHDVTPADRQYDLWPEAGQEDGGTARTNLDSEARP